MLQRVVAIVALVLSTIHVLARKASAQAAARDPLIGLWGGGETILGPRVRGEVLVERVAGAWTLRLGLRSNRRDVRRQPRTPTSGRTGNAARMAPR